MTKFELFFSDAEMERMIRAKGIAEVDYKDYLSWSNFLKACVNMRCMSIIADNERGM